MTSLQAPCPRCSSDRVKRSSNRNYVERLLKTVNIRPYRCIHCGWRGFRYGKESKQANRTKYGPLQIILIVLVLVLTVIATLYYLSREEPHETLYDQSYIEMVASNFS
jgi:hypothetical protein